MPFTPRNNLFSLSKVSLVVGIGDMKVSDRSDTRLITYALGSCVGVVLYDPVAKVGGLLHAMLPESSNNRMRAQDRPAVYVDTGVPALFHAVYALGGVKSRLIVKLAGGAEMLEHSKGMNIGISNVEAVKAILKRNGVSIVASNTGGRDVRTLRLDLATGDLILDTVGKEPHLF